MDKQAGKSPSQKHYPTELKDRAVRMVAELRREDPADTSVIRKSRRQHTPARRGHRVVAPAGEAGRRRPRNPQWAHDDRARGAAHASQASEGAATGERHSPRSFVHRLVVVVEPGVIQPTYLIRGGIPTGPDDNPDQTARHVGASRRDKNVDLGGHNSNHCPTLAAPVVALP